MSYKPEIDLKPNGNLENLKKGLEDLYKEYAKKSKEANTLEKLNTLRDKIETIEILNLDTSSLVSKLKIPLSSDARSQVSKRINSFEQIIEDKNLHASIDNVKSSSKHFA